MSNALNRAMAWADARSERWHPWIAALFSALLHLLLVFILLHASTPIVTTSQSAAGGSRVKVDFIGASHAPQPSPPATPAPPPAQPPTPVAPATSPLQATRVERADHPLPPNTARPLPHPRKPPQRSDSHNAPAPQPTQQPPALPQPSELRRPETWTGQPPGLSRQDIAPENTGLTHRPAMQNQRGREMTGSGPSMELGGYLVYYDVLSEDRLRTWASQGMKEIFIPLPGTRAYMVCPLEIALNRGSGKCRALEPQSPEMQNIGDARQAVTMLRVYKQGDLVWRGPGPYR